MRKYDVYDERGSRKGEIREEEFGREGMNIYDDRGSKIGEIKPRYSGGGSGGAGCGVVVAIAISLIIEIGAIIQSGVYLLVILLLQLVDVIACCVYRKKMQDRYGEFKSKHYDELATMPVLISLAIKTVVMLVITIFSNPGYWFVCIVVNILICLPVATVNFLINIVKSFKSEK